MNVGQIITQAKSLLQGTLSDGALQTAFAPATSPSAINTAIDTVCMVAINNARKFVERIHDFKFTAVSCEVALNADKFVTIYETNLTNALTDGTFRLKSIRTLSKLVDGVAAPREIKSLELEREDVRFREERGIRKEFFNYVIVDGVNLVCPEGSEGDTYLIDGYAWLDDYTSTNDEDFMTRHGADYLMWGTVVEVNHMIRSLIPRQEGTLAPPVGLRDAAMVSLITWDDYLKVTWSGGERR